MDREVEEDKVEPVRVEDEAWELSDPSANAAALALALSAGPADLANAPASLDPLEPACTASCTSRQPLNHQAQITCSLHCPPTAHSPALPRPPGTVAAPPAPKRSEPARLASQNKKGPPVSPPARAHTPGRSPSRAPRLRQRTGKQDRTEGHAHAFRKWRWFWVVMEQEARLGTGQRRTHKGGPDAHGPTRTRRRRTASRMWGDRWDRP